MITFHTEFVAVAYESCRRRVYGRGNKERGIVNAMRRVMKTAQNMAARFMTAALIK